MVSTLARQGAVGSPTYRVSRAWRLYSSQTMQRLDNPLRNVDPEPASGDKAAACMTGPDID